MHDTEYIYIKNQEIEKTHSSLCFVFLVFLNHKDSNGNIFFFFGIKSDNDQLGFFFPFFFNNWIVGGRGDLIPRCLLSKD